LKKRHRKWNFLVLSLLLIIASVYAIKNPGTIDKILNARNEQPESTAAQLSSVCTNPEPLNHVYNPSRLVVLNQCKTVSGAVVKIIKEKDGDTHIRLKVDSQYSDTINQANVDGQGGNLVIEIVCAYEVTQKDAINACTAYENKIPVPKVNDHVAITGQFVSDTEHGGWNEIHPVYEISEK
jgi:hypothetical protein